MGQLVLIILAVAGVWLLINHFTSKKVKRPTGFDEYLIKQFEESKVRASQIPDVTMPEIKEKLIKAIDVDDEIFKTYIRMIKSGEYDSEGLKQEVIEDFKISREELENILNNSLDI